MAIAAVIGAIADVASSIAGSFGAVAAGAATVGDVAVVAGVTGTVLGTVGAVTHNQTLADIGLGLGAAGAVTGLAAAGGLFSAATAAEGPTGLAGGAAEIPAVPGAGEWTPGASAATAGPESASGVIPTAAPSGAGAAEGTAMPSITPMAAGPLAPPPLPPTAGEAATMSYAVPTVEGVPGQAGLIGSAGEDTLDGAAPSPISAATTKPGPLGTAAGNSIANPEATATAGAVSPGPSGIQPFGGFTLEEMNGLSPGGRAELQNVANQTTNGDLNKMLTMLVGGQAVAGLGGGMLQSLSMSDQIALQKLIAQRQQNQLQYQNQNNQFAPNVSFGRTAATGLLGTAAPRLAPVTGGI